MALTANQELIQQMYIAYYQRPADPEGLAYWENQIEQAGDWTAVSAAFGAPENPEYQALYGNATRAELVQSLYQSAFNRTAAQEEIDFWVNSDFKDTDLAFAIINGAQNADRATVDNKVAFADQLATQLGSNDAYAQLADPKALIADVTADTTVTADSVAAAIEAGINPGQSFTLTAGAEAVNEGEAATFTIANGQPNTEYVYKVTGLQAADIAEDTIAIVTTDENGEAALTINVTADALTEGAETLDLAIVGEQATASVTVVDTSVNTAPVVTAEQAFDVPENAEEGTVVAAVAASDADGDDYTYTLTTGNQAGYFAMDETTGEVTLTAAGAAALDAEAEVTSYDLGVVVVDSKGATSAEQAVTVNVTDVNDNAPVLEAFETASVEENTAAGTVVATAVATDADASDTLAYAITQGNDDGLFAIDAETGEVTLAADAPSFEDGTTQFTLTVEASDGTNAAAQDLVVDLTDVNEAPVIADAETGSVVQTADNTANEPLTATATVVDQDNNFNGGSVTLAVEGAFIYNGANSAVDFEGTNFTLIGNQIVADSTVIDGDADLVIGTIDYGTQTDLDTRDAGVTNGADQITISFNQDAVNSGTVQQLLRDIRINDISTPDASDDGAETQAPVTVTVTDAEGLSDSFTRLVDATGAMTLANLDDDAAEVEADGVSTQNVAIDVDGDSVLTENGAQIEGATITVTSAVAGDALHFDNTTQDIGAADTVRLIGDQLALSDGTAETLIGTVTGAGTNSMTITLNAAASTGDITNILDSIQVDLDESVLGEHAISTTISDGLRLETQNATSTFTVVADFVDATAADGTPLGGATAIDALDLGALLTATAAAPVAINGNTYVAVKGTNYSTLDVDQLIADGALTVADGAIIRFVTDAAADLQGVTGLNSLGTLSFGTTATPLDEDLTITAAQANGASGVVDTDTITVNGVADVLDVDLSGFSAVNSGTLDANAALTEAATFTGDLGNFALNVTGAFPLTVAADVADGKDIDHESANAAGDIVVTGVDSNFAGDLSDVNTNGGDVVVEFTQDTTLNADANLATLDLAATVANNTTLTLSTAQATAIATAGGTITGVDAVGDGNTGGSIVVTVVDSDDTADGVQVNNLDLSGLTAGGIAVGATSATAGQVNLEFATDTTLTGTANFGSANVTVASGVTLSGTAAQLTAATISGAGSVAVADLDKTLAANLSDITVAGERTANVAADGTFTGNLGTFNVSVDANATLTTTAAIASGVTISGDATTDEVAEGDSAVQQVGGSIEITDLDGEAVYDLSNITAGADGDGDGTDTAGTVTATIAADTTVTLDAATNLGNAVLSLEEATDNGSDLTVNATAAQINGRTVTGTALDELLVVDLDGASATLDLSNVADTVSLEASVSESIDLTGMNLGGLSAITAQDGDADVQSAINVTMTALQADSISGEVLTAGTLDNNTLDDDTVSVTVNAATAVDGNGDAFAVGGTGVSYTGSVGNDTLNGTQAIDTIVGGDGNDVINGGTGADSITGGAGADTLDGGAGEDTFIYTAVADSGVGAGNRDIINNFEDANLTGGDVIDLSAIAGQEVSAAGTPDGAIDWLGTGAFTATGTDAESAFEARYAGSGDNSIVEIDTTGDGNADMQIELTGVTQLTAGDFDLTAA